MAQENYKPNGWLGIQLGKAIYIQGHSISTVERNLPVFIERVKIATGPVTLPPIDSSPLTSSSFEAPSVSNEDIMDFLKMLKKDIDSMQNDIKKIQEDVQILKN